MSGYVAADGVIIGPDGFLAPLAGVTRAVDLAAWALGRPDCDAIWIASVELGERARDPAFWVAAPGWHVWATGAQGGPNDYASIRRTSGTGRREIAIYANIHERWGVPADTDPRDLVDALIHMAHYFPPSASPAKTILDAIEEDARRHAHMPWLRPLAPATLAELPFPPARAPGHVNPTPRQGAYIHVVDKRSAYIHAATSRAYGSGEPERCGAADYVPNAVGFWEVVDAIPPAGSALPSPWSRGEDAPNGDYYYAPQIAVAHELGWRVTLASGWIWRERHELFRRTAQAIVTQRRAWRIMSTPAARIADTMLKRCYGGWLGIMARRPRAGERAPWYARPDWAGLITAEAYARQVRSIARQEAKTPGYLSVSVDSVAWISDDPDALCMVPDLMSADPDASGYRALGTLADAAAADVLAAAREGVSAAALWRLINDHL